jgi:hypothetical protein
MDRSRELRFTRSRQAVGFWVAAAVFAAAGLVWLVVALPRGGHPELPSGWWGAAPLAAAVVAGRVAYRCTRHAYLVLTPLGVEIFPFFRPAAGMRFVPWGAIAAAEVSDPPRWLSLHFDAARTAGIHVSLAPVGVRGRFLLARAIAGVCERRARAAAAVGVGSVVTVGDRD